MRDDEYKEKLLEEMNRRSSQKMAERRKKVRRQKNIILLLVILFLLISIGTVVYLRLMVYKDGFGLFSGKGKEQESTTELYDINGSSVVGDTPGIAGQAGTSPSSGVGDKSGDNASGEAGTGEEQTPDTASEGEPHTEMDPDNFDINLTFAGDCCMSSDLQNKSQGTMLWYLDNYPMDYYFEKVRSYFEGDDLTVVNCETSISDTASSTRYKGEEGGYWFKAPTKVTEAFTCSSIEAVSICNNHTLDYGEEGLADTEKALEDAGIDWGLRDKVIYFEKGGYKIAIVCVAFYSFAEVDVYALPYLLEAEKNSDYQIVFFHGGAEGVYQEDGWKVQSCHYLVDNGADLVIGSHPHVLQKKETYNGVDIIYSLGNFCFGGNNSPDNRTVIYKVKLNIQKNGDALEVASTEDEFIPCYVYTASTNNWQPAPIEDEEAAEKVVQFMNGERTSPW